VQAPPPPRGAARTLQPGVCAAESWSAECDEQAHGGNQKAPLLAINTQRYVQTLQPGLDATGSLPRWNQRFSPASSATAYLASGSAAAAASTAAIAAATSSGYSGAAAFFPRLRGLAGALLAPVGLFFAGLFFAASAGGLRAARTHMHALLPPGAGHEA